MKNNRLNGPRVIILMAILIVVVILILGNQSFKATEKASFDEFNQRQLVLAQEAAGGIELFFEALAADMKALGRRPEVQQFDEGPTRRDLQHTLEKLEPLDVNDFGVLDADGLLEYNVAASQIAGNDFSCWGTRPARSDLFQVPRQTSYCPAGACRGPRPVWSVPQFR